jgi:nucleoid-associated protein YgaU
MRLSVAFLAATFGLALLVGCEEPKAKEEPRQDPSMYSEPLMEIDDIDTTPPPPPPAPAVRTHVVQKDDTLFKLARHYYDGDQSKWKAIWEANMDKIPDKDKLKPGTELVIP